MNQEIKVVAKPLRTLLFFERMKRLLLHHIPLKEWIMDCTFSYVDLFCSNSYLAKSDKDLMPRLFRNLALWELKSEFERSLG